MRESLREQNPTQTRYWACVIGVLIILPTVIFMQQFARWTTGETSAAPPAALVKDETARSPGVDELTVTSQMMVKFRQLEINNGWTKGDLLGESVGYLDYLDSVAITRAERLRVAIVAGELIGKDAAIRRLEMLEPELTPGGGLAGDLNWLRMCYEEGSYRLPPDATASLVDRHGWFGSLATTWDVDNLVRARWEVVGGADGIGAAMVLEFLVSGLKFLLGLVAVVVLIVVAVRGGIRRTDEPWESRPEELAYLETFGLDCLGLLLVSSAMLVSMVASGGDAAVAFGVGEVLLWLTVAVLFWPLVRPGGRIPLPAFKLDVGLHLGRGFAREVGAGVLVWLACVPVMLVIMIGLALLDEAIFGSLPVVEGEDDVQYPVFPSPTGGSWAVLWLSMLGTVVWAPIVEEVIFRGVLYRYLRSRIGAVLTIIITSIAFGIVHPYDWTGLVQVTFAGVMFGLLREWRGSLIAPMVAHFLHNFTISFGSVLIYLAAS